MKGIGRLGLVALLVALAGCGDDTKDCYEKGVEKACQAICDTGKPGATPACFEIRAREALACVDGKGDCAKACANWKNAKLMSDDVKNVYIAKLGTDAKVAALEKKCP
jgi:hypothetical protein